MWFWKRKKEEPRLGPRDLDARLEMLDLVADLQTLREHVQQIPDDSLDVLRREVQYLSAYIRKLCDQEGIRRD